MDNMRVIVIGMDGLDPTVTETLMNEGKLPSFSNLAAQGSYSRLSTTVPPQSPVAWSSFATGMNPGKHGIFDFLYRDPSTYMPHLALTSVTQPRSISIGTTKIPLGKEQVRSCMKGLPFWEITSQRNVQTVVLHAPLTYPPSHVHGKMLSGMGTPDIRGTQGTFTFYTSKIDMSNISASDEKVVKVDLVGGTVSSCILGPMEKKDMSLKRVPFTITLQATGVRLRIQGVNCEVCTGTWSPWVKVRFSTGTFDKQYGICRFFLKSIEPNLELYMSPINFDPEEPSTMVSYPASFSRSLAKQIGLYHTLGQPGDTWVLNEGYISDEAAAEQYGQVLDEDEKILFNELSSFHSGVFFFYFGITDTIQHMFYDRPSVRKDGVVEKLYKRMDAVLDKIMRYVDENTVLMVLSDHGFGQFSRAVHINAWLKQNGYLKLKPGHDSSDAFFENVDWSQTRAYALGLSGIYINQRLRECDGIVDASESLCLQREISGKLSSLHDPESGARVVAKVYAAADEYHGPYAHNAPDLVIGFDPGWRTSWQTALGCVPQDVFEHNSKHWKGDHIFDASAVPGVLFMNRKVIDGSARIVDIAPTILSILKLPVPREMDGVPLL